MKAMTADLSMELAEATLYADDGVSKIVQEFKFGILSWGVDDIGASTASDLTRATINANGVVVSTSEDGGEPVKELGLSFTTRIVRREYNLQEHWNMVLELSTTLKNLGSSVSTLDVIADYLEGTSMVSNNDIHELLPFNHFCNSYADDGLAYWVSSGFEADGENGAADTASFKAVGVEGMTLSLAQTVYPSNRGSYTLSSQIALDDLEKLDSDCQVGIEVVIEYETAASSPVSSTFTDGGALWLIFLKPRRRSHRKATSPK